MSASTPSGLAFVRASRQNGCFDEILEAYAEAARHVGLDVEWHTDQFPAPRPDWVTVYVPHEYLALTEPVVHPSPEDKHRSIAVATEQPGSQWFELSEANLHEVGAVLDINERSARELESRGHNVRFAPIGYVAAWDAWHGRDDWDGRSTDVLFLGSYSPRRGRALASTARLLSHHRTRLLLSDPAHPVSTDDHAGLHGSRKWQELTDTRVMLNVHSSEQPYFEWHRVVGAICNGCIVVSEHSTHTDPLVPGEHFLSTALEGLAPAIEAVFDDPDLANRLRRDAWQRLRDEQPPTRLGETLLEAARELTSAPFIGWRTVTPPPLPVRAVAPPPLTASSSLEMVIRDWIQPIAQTVTKLAATRDISDSEQLPRTTRYGRQTVDPRVSVITPMYNGARFVEQALQSVIATGFEQLEVVLVDDASSDDTLEVATTFLDGHPELSAIVVERPVNGGLGSSRNLGIEHSRGEYVFALDQDNEVYPHAFDRLVEALDDDPDAAFAWGILEKFSGRGPFDLESWRPWTPMQFRLANYIDAMAMVRRSAYDAVGGYTTEPVLHGWEDFDLWCSFAERGWIGIRVPEVLSRYRVTPGSMVTGIDVGGGHAWGALMRRHVTLFHSEEPDEVGV